MMTQNTVKRISAGLALWCVIGLTAWAKPNIKKIIKKYEKFYHPLGSGGYITEDCFLKTDEVPTVYEPSWNVADEAVSLHSEYNWCIGYYSWNGPNTYGTIGVDIPEIAKILCIQKRAKIAIYSTEYVETVYSDDYGVKRYDYNIYLFVPMADYAIDMIDKTGLSCLDLKDSDRKRLGQNTGTLIWYPYKWSSAFVANIQRDDIIIKMNGRDILDLADYKAVLDTLDFGDELHLTIVRNGEQKDITYTLSELTRHQ